MVELERYELAAGPSYRFESDRRDFLKLLGGGIVVLLAFGEDASPQESGRARAGGAMPQDLAAWLHIGQDGKITVFCGKVEFGQNIRTSLTQAVAEQLGAPPQSIRLVMGDTDLTPFDMGTFGSRTTPTMAPQLRRAAACAREMLLDLAAQNLQADRAGLRVADGAVGDSNGKSVSFGELTRGKELVKTIGHDRAAKPLAQSAPKADGRSFVTGEHRYTSDLKRPGMLYGAVLRPPAMNSTLVSMDPGGAERIAGVQVVREGNFAGVVGADRSVFPRALAAINARWKTEPQSSSQDLFRVLKEHPQSEGPVHSSGSFDAGWNEAEHKLESSYRIAYIAHTPMETRAALAEWNGGKLTVWTGTQRPFGVRTELAQAFQMAEDRIRVIVPDTGAGYGGKHTGECAIEAARLAKAAGKPVKLTWTREEEFAWAYFRPAGVIDVRGAVRKDGSLAAWEFHNYNSGASGLDTPYDAPNQIVKFHTAESPLRQGSYRGLAATANHFARESHMDELAHAAGLDPLEFRLKNLKDARMKAVLEGAAGRFGWGKSKPAAQRGFGIACGFEKGGYVASCAEVSIAQPGGRVKIERVVTAFECGAIVNPEHLKNQVEGAVVMGIGGALFEAIDFADGKILNGKLSRYRVPRFSDLPILETVLIDRKDLDSAGAGETPIVALAPAVGNAIFKAAGVRLRSLPMAPDGVNG